MGPYVELEMIHDSFNDIIPQIESIPIAVVPASAVAIAPGLIFFRELKDSRICSNTKFDQ